MEIILGKYSGFCNGVKNAVLKTEELLSNNKEVYSLGEIVHNKEVIDSLKKKGLIIKNSIDEIPDGTNLIIRAHGEAKDIYEKAREKKINIIDLTCGRVKLIHNKIEKHKKDYFIIIIGKKDHPETIAHKSYINDGYVISDSSDILYAYKKYCKSKYDKVYVVAQTTFNSLLFDTLVSNIKDVFKIDNIIVDNTICNVTNLRQDEVKKISQKVNKMIIIGDENSANTRELYNIASNYCKDVYLIQTCKDVKTISFNDNDIVGIATGASTPNEVFDDIINHIVRINH